MAVQNFPFDSLSADNPDRAANSKIFADYLKSFFSDGIFPVLTQFPDMHQLAVRASNPAGMSVVVDTGMGLISGRQYAQDAERTLQIPAADVSFPRKDRIVLRMDLNTQYRNNELYVVTGTAASNPQPPALTRNNVVYELALATISVAANATSITATDITDERANTDVCGYVTNVLGQVDTSVINAQFQAFFEQTQENTADWEDAQQAAFTAWFNTIKGQLGEDAAGNLQNQIGTLPNLTTSEKSNLVGAINEVNAKEPDVLDTMEEIDANTDAGKVAGALAVKELSSDIKFPDGVGFYPDIKDGQRGYNIDPARGADTFSPFSSITSVGGSFSAYLPAGGMEAHTVIDKPDNVSIKRITIQINRNINGATYIRVITNKNANPTTVVQYTSVNQPPALNEDISFNIVDDPDSIEIQAQTVSGGSMPQTNIMYTVDFF